MAAIETLHGLDAPFYVRFKASELFLTTTRVFARYAPLLSASPSAAMALAFGGTARQRLDAIAGVLGDLDPARHVITDVGCGTGALIGHVAAGVLRYHAIDIDSRALASAKSRFAHLRHVAYHASLDAYLKSLAKGPDQSILRNAGNESSSGDHMVVCTEVVEHMPVAAATVLVQQLCTRLHFSALVVTTPDRRFNPLYALGPGQMRHPDHDWEMTGPEFEAWIREKVLAEVNGDGRFTVAFGGMGHSVNGIYSTQYAIIKCNWSNK